MAGGIPPTSRPRLKRRAMPRSPRSKACASCKAAMAISSACSRRCVTPRARRRRCMRWRRNCRRSASSSSIPSLRDDADLAARLAAPANDNTGIFHDHNEPGSRGGFSLYVPEYYTPDRALSAGGGAARRQRQRPRLPVELAARRPQPRRDPGRADRHRADLGLDGRRHRHAEPDAHPGSRAVALERRSGADAADRHERRRHVLLRHRA